MRDATGSAIFFNDEGVDMHKTTILKIAVASVSVVLLAACNKEDKVVVSKPAAPPAAPVAAPAAPPPAAAPVAAAPAPAPAAPAAPAPAAPAAAAPAPVLASAEFNNDPQLRADLLEVKRASGGSLTVRWRMVNTAGQAQGMVAAQPKGIYYTYEWSQLYYTDPAENKKYGFLQDSQQNRLVQIFHGTLEAGQQKGNWAKFPAPPATSKKVTVHIPNFPPFEDIPVTE
jgi:hypothetical protein